ncbi:hypothetical protein IFM89_018682 [Coptis chinensis]|uniref:Xyloglucan endotransglucosylase/hydrolase n=1 Tax=Coptis chinensis TaxID=261450 RepID=A0A835IAV6_9MAGN|nr:hypothetical protein IFM89_018682 [Coptis chinensis]
MIEPRSSQLYPAHHSCKLTFHTFPPSDFFHFTATINSYSDAHSSHQLNSNLLQSHKPNCEMACSTYSSMVSRLFIISTLLVAALAGNFYQDFDITWGDGRGKMLSNGQLLTLSLDKASGSGFQSKKEYLFGKIDMQLKLVPGNSAGTVTAYYQFYLWFDPTADFHTYSILWNPQRIIFSVDGTPIREFKNSESLGVPFPKNQPMRIYSSLWNADDWATRGGLVKTDWTHAPFTASYRNFASASKNNAWYTQQLDSTSQGRMKWVQKNYMIYNYCADTKRFPQGLPPECATTNL